MPKVKVAGKVRHYPYTPSGMVAAKRAKKRVVKAKKVK
jgi:hypothetical protein